MLCTFVTAQFQHGSVNNVHVHCRGSNDQPRSTQRVCFIYRDVFSFLNIGISVQCIRGRQTFHEFTFTCIYLFVYLFIYLFLVYLMTPSVDWITWRRIIIT